jgi:hypothetical protein
LSCFSWNLHPTPPTDFWPTHQPALCLAWQAVMCFVVWWAVMCRGMVWFCWAYCLPACLPWECSRIVCWENMRLRNVQSSLGRERSGTQKGLLHGMC